MCNLLKTYLIFIVVFLAIQNGSASFLRTWTFLKNNETAANGIVCRGPFCDDLDIQVISCSGIYFDIDYTCNTPDLRSEDFDTSFTILCYRNVYRNDNCYVEVHVTKETDKKLEVQSPSILKLTLYLILVQLLFVGVTGGIALGLRT